MVAKVEQLGNDQGLRLPKQVLERTELSVGDDVEVTLQGNQIILRKVSGQRFDLTEMVTRMPHDYEVREESFGKPEGREKW